MRGGILTAAALALGVMAAPAFASGSGSAPAPRGSDFESTPRQTEAQRMERRGATQVNRKITCKKCEYNGRLNASTAPEIAQGVRNGKFELSDGDRQAVLFFLRQRYGV